MLMAGLVWRRAVLVMPPVTVGDIIAGHGVLDLVSADRIYLNGYIPTLQVGGQVSAFLARRGAPSLRRLRSADRYALPARGAAVCRY
jgi:hypothetical protein